MASLALTLYDVEEHLVALADTAEVVPPEQEQQFLAELETALTRAADKRDQVAGFLAHLDAPQKFASQEIARLQDLKRHYETVQDRLEGYVVSVIQRQGTDAKGKYPKLEGHHSLMYIQRSPASVEITDAAAVPLDYERATITIDAAQWQEILNAFPALLFTACKLEPNKSTIKAALDAGAEVPGARIAPEKYGLRRK